MKIACSVPILTLNTRPGLERLLPLLIAAFDDVFIVDGNSTDGTREYAASLGARVENQFSHGEMDAPIQDFAATREHSWSLAKHDWVCYFDADEYPSESLIQAIGEIVQQNDTRQLHEFIRVACLPSGEVVKHAFFYPEYCLRLFARSSGAALRKRPVHERFVLPDETRVVRHPQIFYASWPTPEVFWRKQLRYLELEARAQVPASLWWLFRWGIVYHLATLLGQTVRSVVVTFRAILCHERFLPWSYVGRMLEYRLLSMRSAWRAWQRVRSH